MSKKTIIGRNRFPNIPWEDRPEGSHEVMWRYSGNPVIPRDLIPSSNSIFNSAVVPFEGEFAGVFRCDDKRRAMQLHAGRTKDAINWELDHDPISFICDDPEMGNFVYGYDPRVCKIDDRYYVTWCNGYHGPTIGVAYTYDFKSSINWKTPSCPSTGTVLCSQERSMGTSPCSADPAITAIPHSATSSIAKAPI